MDLDKKFTNMSLGEKYGEVPMPYIPGLEDLVKAPDSQLSEIGREIKHEIVRLRKEVKELNKILVRYRTSYLSPFRER